jgi:DNA-binding response OmpR family regulator
MIPLSGAEFDLLVVFLEHPQRILTREQLIDLTRGQGMTPSTAASMCRSAGCGARSSRTASGRT